MRLALGGFPPVLIAEGVRVLVRGGPCPTCCRSSGMAPGRGSRSSKAWVACGSKGAAPVGVDPRVPGIWEDKPLPNICGGGKPATCVWGDEPAPHLQGDEPAPCV